MKEEEEETVSIQKQVEGKAVTVKEEREDDAVFGVKDEMTVTSKKEEEETGCLGPFSQMHLKTSNGSNAERALINTSKYCLKNRSTNSAIVELMCGVKGEICNCYIHILTFKLFFLIDIDSSRI